MVRTLKPRTLKPAPIAVWHGHHNIPVSFVTSIEDRTAAIEGLKPAEEIPTRLRLMKKVQGQLPEDVTRTGLATAEAVTTLGKAERAYGKAERAYKGAYDRKAAEVALKAAEVALDEAEVALDEAEVAFVEALANHADEINALHRQECVPDCPWDGKTLFPGAGI